MKRSKFKWNEDAIEAVMEIFLTIIGIGVGALVYSLLGIELGEHTDYEWLSFVGIVAVFAVLGVIVAVLNLVGKIKKGKDGDDDEGQDY